MNNHVNASGFPLQIAIKRVVDEFSHMHGFKVIFDEHSWKNEATGEAGFIDLIASNQKKHIKLVIECKRVKDTSWIFMRDARFSKNSKKTKSFLFCRNSGEDGRYGWVDLNMTPPTPESSYCVIPGTDNRSKSLIERTAAELVSSAEAFANECRFLSLKDRDVRMTILNVIVTTAALKLCDYDPSLITLEDGTLKEANFTDVPYIRFRKQLSALYQIPEVYKVAGEQEVALAKESTVFVVNSMHFHEFINQIGLDGSESNEQYFR